MPTLTPRENFIRFLKGEPCAHIPTDGDQKDFLPAFLVENVARGRVVQQTPFDERCYGGRDWFGVEWRFDPAVNGSMEVAPLLDELEGWEEKVTFPDLDTLDWEGCARENAEFLQTDRLLTTTIYSGFFERLISFVGFENAAMALIDEDEQDDVKKLFDRLADFYIDVIRRLHRHFNVEYVKLHDDWGTQRGPMFSTAVHQEMIVPYIRRVVTAAHQEGVFFEMHSCGKIEPLIPGMIETGADTWCGQDLNDKNALIEAYGDRFRFGVELRSFETISDEAVREMTRDFKRKYAGKLVWVMAGKGLPPAQSRIVYEELARPDGENRP